MKLHEVWLNEEPGFTAARTANDQYVFISGIFGLLGTAVHGQKFRLSKDDIIGEHRVHVRLNVFGLAPSG